LIRLAIIIGTRPEGIKLLPVVQEARSSFSASIQPIVIDTGQHTDLLKDVFDFFNIHPDHHLSLTRSDNLLSTIQGTLTQGLERLFVTLKPDIVMVQGDTLSTLAGALAAFYQQIRIAHIEAGLRSGTLLAPFPEEAHRLMIARLAHWQFTPTKKATLALQQEGITSHVYHVGNTVVDAVHYAKKTIPSTANAIHPWLHNKQPHRKMIVVTIHRRENWGTPLHDILSAIKTVAHTHKDTLDIVWITHANPALSERIQTALSSYSNISIYPPAPYPQLIHLLSHAYLILTDSGGIQEEAPSLNVPVLVARDVSERMEGIEAGCALLVGTKKETLVHTMTTLLSDPATRNRMRTQSTLYGDGTSSYRILNTLVNTHK